MLHLSPLWSIYSLIISTLLCNPSFFIGAMLKIVPSSAFEVEFICIPFKSLELVEVNYAFMFVHLYTRARRQVSLEQEFQSSLQRVVCIKVCH